jgi:hypothetical protein
MNRPERSEETGRTRGRLHLGVNAGIEVCRHVLAVTLDGSAVVGPAHTHAHPTIPTRGVNHFTYHKLKNAGEHSAEQ